MPERPMAGKGAKTGDVYIETHEYVDLRDGDEKATRRITCG